MVAAGATYGTVRSGPNRGKRFFVLEGRRNVLGSGPAVSVPARTRPGTPEQRAGLAAAIRTQLAQARTPEERARILARVRASRAIRTGVPARPVKDRSAAAGRSRTTPERAAAAADLRRARGTAGRAAALARVRSAQAAANRPTPALRQRLDRAFRRLDRGGNNLVTIAALRREFPDLKRAQFEGLIRDARASGRYTADTLEGGTRGQNDRRVARAAIREGGVRLAYLARRT